MPTIQKRQERIACRIRPEDKSRIASAAELMGLSTSEFLVSKAIKAADEILSSHQTIILSERDWDLVMDGIGNPPEPNEALKKAAIRFNEGRDTGDTYEW